MNVGEDFVTTLCAPDAQYGLHPALLMPFILLYGIYGGVTTPTEAAAMAAPIKFSADVTAMALRPQLKDWLEQSADFPNV